MSAVVTFNVAFKLDLTLLGLWSFKKINRNDC